ncbi:catechol O-methyltransferase [Colletotrichum melonis]|uniref:catechol O-methyltransferase n=1 Tax=Colletotrichum melonis TaxID=1209925 RepID=A0AAI9V7B5_9PEZI|nr:catechol O-methyltransferase [Colletotrichum melonis]
MAHPYHNIKDFQSFCKARAVALHKYVSALPEGKFEENPWELVRLIEDFANTEKLPMIFRETKMNLARVALADMSPKPKLMVEFGSFVGNSTIAWGAMLRDFYPGDNSGIRVYSFELDPELAEIARDVVKLAGMSDIVTVVDGPGAESLKTLVKNGDLKTESVDAVFFDHWEDIYLPDLKLCEELGVLHKGSVVLADNTDIPGAPKYLEYVRGNMEELAGTIRYQSKTHLVPSSSTSHGPRALEVTIVV